MEHEQSPRQLLKQAVRAAAAGDRSQAHFLLRQVIMNDPTNEMAWLWLVAVAENLREARIALRHVEQLNPNHPKLPEARRWLESRASAAPALHTDYLSPVKAAGTPTPRLEVPSAQRPVPSAPDGIGEQKSEMLGVADTAPHEVLPEPEVSPRHRRWPRWVTILLIVVLIIVLFLLAFVVLLRSGVARSASVALPDQDVQINALRTALNMALSEARWVEAVSMLETMHRINPADPIWQHSAANAYFQLSVMRRKEGKLPDAQRALDQALHLAPGEATFLREQRLLRHMLEGLQRYHRGEWRAAVEAFLRVSTEEPGYADVDSWLYGAYFNLGIALQDAGQLTEAQQAFQSALALRPDQPDAQRKVEEIAALLRPPTPTPPPTPTATPTPSPEDQLILVDISEQRMYVYENGRLLWNWVVSTGEPGRDTATGHFRVLNKIEVAYASTWNLDMPYWLGIYRSGPLENGIHALPINRATGVKLWEGLLGRRVSYGCVILSDENARTLFEWAQIGTPVVIQW